MACCTVYKGQAGVQAATRHTAEHDTRGPLTAGQYRAVSTAAQRCMLQLPHAASSTLDGVRLKQRMSHQHLNRCRQEALSFCEDCEDVVSMAMSAVQALLLKHGIDPSRVGRC